MQETPAKTSTNHKTEGNNPFCSSTGTWAYICHAGTFPQSGKAFKTTTWSQNCGCETPFSLMYVIQGCSNNQELLKNRRPTTKPRAQGPLFPFLLFSVTRGFLQSYETGATPIGIYLLYICMCTLTFQSTQGGNCHRCLLELGQEILRQHLCAKCSSRKQHGEPRKRKKRFTRRTDHDLDTIDPTAVACR